MKRNEQENNIMTDYSGFKWSSFIPGETFVDDISVSLISCNQSTFIKRIIPPQYFSPCYCIQIVTKGSMRINLNNQWYDILPNMGWLISPDFLVKRPEESDSMIEMYIISMSRKFAKELNPQFSMAQMANIYVHPVWRMSEEKTQRCIQFFELLRVVVGERNRTSALHLVRAFFHYLSGDIPFGQRKTDLMTRSEEITGRFLVLVDEHCEQQHSLDWYADQLCLSTRYVANTVKETLGMTASECIERAIMQRAKTLLVSTPMPIQQIADQLGFQNQSHFGTFFKRHEGISPAAFRKQQ